MPIKTMQEEWRNYRDKMYPNGITAIQNIECHQAFFAGSALTLEKLNNFIDLPDGQAERALADLTREVMAILEARANQSKFRN
jgi:hypothetical protein